MSGSADELRAGYEAMRAAATGGSACATPRGWALLCSQGVAAWMRAWAPLPAAPSTALGGERPQLLGVGAEMVRVLTEMALGCRTTLTAS